MAADPALRCRQPGNVGYSLLGMQLHSPALGTLSISTEVRVVWKARRSGRLGVILKNANLLLRSSGGIIS